MSYPSPVANASPARARILPASDFPFSSCDPPETTRAIHKRLRPALPPLRLRLTRVRVTPSPRANCSRVISPEHPTRTRGERSSAGTSAPIAGTLYVGTSRGNLGTKRGYVSVDIHGRERDIHEYDLGGSSFDVGARVSARLILYGGKKINIVVAVGVTVGVGSGLRDLSPSEFVFGPPRLTE